MSLSIGASMRLSAFAVIVAALLAVSGACAKAPSAEFSDVDRAVISDTLRSLARAFERGINALDVDSQLRLFSADSDLSWAGDGQLVLMPKDSLSALYRSVYRGYRTMDFKWDTLRTTVLGPDAGVVTGAGHYSVTDTLGTTERKGVVGTYVFARRNGIWQLVHGHASHRAMP